jgi:muramoyltetrapeptide carboxypeptidase
VNGAARKPPALHPGETVAVVAPASAVDAGRLDRGLHAIAAMGYRAKVSPRVLGRSGILAGEDAARAAELNAAFADPEVKAIFCARGGYGSGRLLPLIDFAAAARRPKIFLGFSDLTFLLNALVERARMVCFHGPMVAMDFARGLTERSREQLQALLSGRQQSFALKARDVIRPGNAQGEVVGGCLSILAAMMATPYAPRFEERILFLEDTGEKAYRVDRMLVQLKQAGVLSKVAGIVFGALSPPAQQPEEAGVIRRFVEHQVADLGCPVLFGIEAGHGTENLTLPLGLPARIDGSGGRLIFDESAVSRDQDR